MTPTTIAIFVVALVISLILATPQVRAFLKVGFRMRRDDLEEGRSKRADGRNLDGYHNAVRATILNNTSSDTASPKQASSEANHPHCRVVIDERTWADLDLESIFAGLDHTRSRPGQQYLRYLLRTPALSAERVMQMDRHITQLESDATTCDAITNALSLTDDRRASLLTNLIFGELPNRPFFWWIFPLMTVTAIVLLTTVYAWPRALIGLLVIAVINIVLQVFYRPRLDALIPAIHEIPAFLKTARILGALRTDLFPAERETLANGVSQLRVLQRATLWLKFEPSQQANDLVASLYTYASFLLTLDMTAFVFAINSAKRLRRTLQQMFEAIGYVDAIQSVAAWRRTLPFWSTPVFAQTEKEISVAGMVHPLVKNAVANNVIIQGASALITGSNMSGKTTFIRALGINAILAQSLATVVATGWRAPLLHVSSSIGRADSVLDGKSYYLAEVESVLALIRQKGDGAQHLFVIDELFRGTNTAERVAGAYAVLEYLNRGDDIVVVATHDTELLSMLGNAYNPYHFREEISGDNLTFDFILRTGQATTRNAIALLELMKYPAEIVARARSVLR